MAQIRRWIRDCITFHSRSCGSSAPAKLPHRILDVGLSDGSENPYLITPGNKEGHYITLSYRWGDSHSLTTTSTTLEQREAGIPLDLLPQTMRDAVLLTRQLDIRYLWIDALCILQDSPADWERQSGQMGEIYQNALLNISADVAEHSNTGFLAKRNRLEVRNCEHPTLVDMQKKLICPFVNTGDVIYGINKNVLTQRGWIFPERLFSKRILHWSHREVVWECISHLASERHPAGLGGSRFLVDSNWNKIRGITRAPFDQLEPDIQDRRLRECAARARAYSTWYELVREYTKRSFTKSGDKLPAISALATLFLAQLRSHTPPLHQTFDYIAGLWLGDISCGLAWSVDWSQHTPKDAHHGDKPHLLKGLSEYRSPSFSWASVDGPVRFHDNTNSYYFSPGREPKFVDSQIKIGGSDPFGKVVEGYIKLRACVQPLGSLWNPNLGDWNRNSGGPFVYLWYQPETRAELAKKSGEMEPKVQFSNVHHLSDVSLLYLGATHEDSNEFIPRDLLFMMLLPVEGDATRFYRIGLLTAGNSPSHWLGTPQDITII